MAKSLIDYNKIDDLETVFNRIRAISVTDMANIANEILEEDKLSSLTFYPTEA